MPLSTHRLVITQITENIIHYMGSVILPAIGIAIATTLLGSTAFHLLAPVDVSSPHLALEKNCEKIASEGYKLHLEYPNAHPSDLPTNDMNRLLYLDNLWINECVSGLPASTVFDIIQRVEDDFYTGE